MRRIHLVLFLFFLCSVCVAQPIVKPSFIIPTDERVLYRHEMDVILEEMKEVQAFYASEMQRLGYGQKTFEFKTHMPLYVGRGTAEEYRDPAKTFDDGIPTDNVDEILLVFLVGVKDIKVKGSDPAAGVYRGACIRGECQKYGIAAIAYDTSVKNRKGVIAHELGHAFGFDGHLGGKGNMMYHTLHGTGSLDDLQIHRDTAKVINKSPVLYVQTGIVPIESPDPTATRNNGSDAPSDNIDADVNNDGYVDLSDVMIVRSAIKNMVSYDTDVNGDGKTDEVDVLLVKAKAMEALAAAAPSMLRRKKAVIWGALKRRH